LSAKEINEMYGAEKELLSYKFKYKTIFKIFGNHSDITTV
jgi:ribosomal protein L25 (general stress protein Ctc)